jgi:hypothetical protein
VRFKRLLVALVALVGIVGTALLVDAGPALASSCYGTGCTGKDPQTYACNTTAGSPVYSLTYPSYGGEQTMQLRWSWGCSSWWARSIRNDCAYPVTSYVRIERQIWTPYGYYDANNYYARMTNCNGGTNWTLMVPDTSDDRVRVCHAYSMSGPTNPATITSWGCSPWYS